MSKTRFILYFVLLTGLEAARILVIIPTASISHQVVFRPLTNELIKRRHEVTIITPNPMYTDEDRPANLTEIDVHDITYGYFKENLREHTLKFGQRGNIFDVIKESVMCFSKIVEIQVQSEAVQTFIKKVDRNYFDLLFIEACGRPFILYSHLFNAPVILGSSFGMMLGNAEVVGAPNQPFFYPQILRQRLFNLTFWEKVKELHSHYSMMKVWYEQESVDRKTITKFFGDDVPSYDELYKNVDMLFLNVHPLWSNGQPLPPNVISIWGIHKNPEKSLPQDLKKYLDSSVNGVIYFSFGSNVHSSFLPQEKIQVFLNVFSKLSYDVIWKWETDVLPGKTDNIKIAQWLPQTDLLRHPNITLFITQGGLQSTDEAITAGVPLLGIPMLGDQWYNVEMYEYHKIGVLQQMDTITEESLLKSIHTVINDKSYKENVLRLRSLMSDEPLRPLEKSLWWIEYVLRHGGAKHLRAAGSNKTMYEYYELEFLIKLAALGAVLAVLTVSALYFTCINLLPKHKVKVT